MANWFICDQLEDVDNYFCVVGSVENPGASLGFLLRRITLLEDRIRLAIQREAKKLIDRYQSYHNVLHLEHSRKTQRMSGVNPKIIKTPKEWAVHPLHNPFYVYRKAGAIAKSIAKKIELGTYAPFAPYQKSVPKKGVGTRMVSIYQIPDAAISTMFYRQLLDKNIHRFSSFAYAYRNDRNVHFAIQDIAIDLSNSTRTYIAEFDFSNFFGSINHAYLRQQFTRNGYLISADDLQVINAFLNAQGERGVPQGTSISLFLANLVCWELDKSLEACGVKFARYADDTVIWTSDYSKICDAFRCIDEFSKKTGVPINDRKSDGINLLVKKGMPAEIKSKKGFDFLGYTMSVGITSVKAERVKSIKKNISYILAKHLLQPLRQHPLRATIIPANDTDRSLIAAMAEIRRYLYGGLTTRQIFNFINGRTKRIYFKGLMSYYPLINDLEQLRSLDGWLVSAVHRAVREREKLLRSHGFNRSLNFPFNVKKSKLVEVYRSKVSNGKRQYEVPSLSLLYSALIRAVNEVGIRRVMNSRSIEYDY